MERPIGLPDITNRRGQEVQKILRMLMDSPVVFVWAKSGEGKTTFARAFREDITIPTQIIHAWTFRDRMTVTYSDPTYDSKVNYNTSILFVDEFDSSYLRKGAADRADRLVEGGMKLVLVVHESKNNLIARPEWRPLDPAVAQTILKYPQAPWFHLPKFE